MRGDSAQCSKVFFVLSIVFVNTRYICNFSIELGFSHRNLCSSPQLRKDFAVFLISLQSLPPSLDLFVGAPPAVDCAGLGYAACVARCVHVQCKRRCVPRHEAKGDLSRDATRDAGKASVTCGDAAHVWIQQQRDVT